ncbi:hypothetical protein TrVE_jg6927 [Triparma verrucosa]|uniref:Uncharacterized protein n=1 Tax=Triparma verrucosa TaxID=1606542 RepID=A0A9W7CDI3_9STRA|nr:hypothetical protein TrVE_jg6927 [Triparma verrucosa]
MSSDMTNDAANSTQVHRLTFTCVAPLSLGQSLHMTVPSHSHSITPLIPPPPITSSVQTIPLHTTPESYPVWKTLDPVVVGSCSSGGRPFNYRYCVKTTAGAGVRWEGEELSSTGGVVVGNEVGILPESKSGRIGRKVLKYRSIESSDAATITDNFESGFSSTNTDASCKAYQDLYTATHTPQKTRTEFVSDHELQDDRASSSPQGSDRKSSLFLICYHLPITFTKSPSTQKWSAQWQNSLLAKTAGSVADAVPTYWIGGVRLSSLPDSEKTEIKQLCSAMNAYPIFVPTTLHEKHYLGMCKQVLWPSFHNIDMLDLSTSRSSNMMEMAEEAEEGWGEGGKPSIWDQSRLHKDFWASYKEVNRLFNAEASRVMLPGDSAWVHDYHLALLPKFMESTQINQFGRRTTNTIFFLHIPFPTSQVFRELEYGEPILEGMLSADVVGFHAFDHARHFLNASKRLMGLNYESKFGGLIGLQYRGRTVMVSTSHVSIEPTVMTTAMDDANVKKIAADLRKKHEGKLILAGVDVAQKLSGIPLKFLAFEKLMDDYPVYQRKVVLVQRCFVPQNRKGDEKQTLIDVHRIVERIKSKFGRACIDYEEVVASELPIPQRVGLWLAADVFFTSAIREGLNLSPLEYVYCKGMSTPGVVVCSEFSAACNILNGALRINPFDVQQTSAVLDTALKMDISEKETRRGRDLDFVSTRTASKWSKHVLRDLREAVEASSKEDGSNVVSDGELMKLPHVNQGNVLTAYNATDSRVIICDYGGTLLSKEAPGKYLKKDISATSGRQPRPEVMESLTRLCADPKNTVFVVSGVNRRELEGSLGKIPGLGLAASNGACFSWPSEVEGGARVWKGFQFGVDWEEVKAVAIPIMSKYAARTNGSSLKVLDLSLCWSFFSSDPEWGAIQAKYIVPELQEKLKAFDIQIVTLKGQVEIVPKLLHKGIVVKRILREISSKKGVFPQFLMVVGDDKSDEPMFNATFDFLAEQVNPEISTFTTNRLSVATLQSGGSGSFDSADPTATARPRGVSDSHIRRLSHEPGLQLPKYTKENQFAFTFTVGRKTSNATEFIYNSRELEELLVNLAKGESGEIINRRGSNLSGGSWDDQHTVDASFYEV